MSLVEQVAEVFTPEGPLARQIPAFKARPQQTEMAERIADAIKSDAACLVEAGTGTGKTFAYLVPAMLSGGKVVLSTGTKTLQDQLFERDIPTVREALGAPIRVALLKGRSNYVCLHHLERAHSEGRFLQKEDARHITNILRFSKMTKRGDKAECVDVPESASVWHMATSTKDNCLGSECAQYEECFVVKARREALEADLVVVNHHLFFADVALKEEGMAELLPNCNTVIFDEAHQLPETAGIFFGQRFTTTQIFDLAQDVRLSALAEARDCLDLPVQSAALDKAARDFRLALGNDTVRQPASNMLKHAEFLKGLDVLADRLNLMADLLQTQAGRSPDLERAWQRAVALGPSATLAVQGDFGHYKEAMGLHDIASFCWDSPFDYGTQAMLCCPTDLPDPNSPEYTERLVDKALPLIQAAQGRTFFLCTSLRAMQKVRTQLETRLAFHQPEITVLCQGDAAKNELLRRFRESGNAVLVGSQSFWEGVDVPGDALSLVVIDKLPFAAPDDPVLSARIDALNRQGKNAFMHYQLPHAVINVKQGAGRLIRSERDQGVLVIGDPRLVTKAYGKKVWRSLPPMARTRDIAEAETFLINTLKDHVA
ncbi:MAG: ATP-dependent DNA helicase [Rhodocyclales bacterium]|nr:ATP-dependent DNA helicase [Rhodocyclales bacterium]